MTEDELRSIEQRAESARAVEKLGDREIKVRCER